MKLALFGAVVEWSGLNNWGMLFVFFYKTALEVVCRVENLYFLTK